MATPPSSSSSQHPNGEPGSASSLSQHHSHPTAPSRVVPMGPPAMPSAPPAPRPVALPHALVMISPDSQLLGLLEAQPRSSRFKPLIISSAAPLNCHRPFFFSVSLAFFFSSHLSPHPWAYFLFLSRGDQSWWIPTSLHPQFTQP